MRLWPVICSRTHKKKERQHIPHAVYSVGNILAFSSIWYSVFRTQDTQTKLFVNWGLHLLLPSTHASLTAPLTIYNILTCTSRVFPFFSFSVCAQKSKVFALFQFHLAASKIVSNFYCLSALNPCARHTALDNTGKLQQQQQ